MPQTFDYVAKEGDTAPLFEDTLTYTNGQAANLSGATVQLILRARFSSTAITLPVTVVNATLGQVQYAPSSLTVVPAGYYIGGWVVQFATTQMTFPTEGYLTVRIEENLTGAATDLVSVTDAKDYLNIPGNDRTHDAKLARFIAAARPVIEDITGPIIQTVFSEWHDGGSPIIQIRRRPSTSYATMPVLTLLTVDEFIGSTTHPLAIVADPAAGTQYSCMIDEIGTITRRTSGGGIGYFRPNVHITYRAGQSSVPPNVYEGTLELLRVNYDTTQATGSGRYAQADEQDQGAPFGFYVPRGVRQLIAPSRRAPAIG